MATILLQAAGAYLGGLLGPVGSAIGTAAGALAGYAVDRVLLNGSRRVEGPRLSGARPFTAEEGVSLPRLYGTARLGGILIWATRFEESRSTRRQGKLGPKVTEYSYYANVAFALCEGEIAGIRRVWADGREVDRESIELRVYQGGRDQLPDPLIEARQGEGNAPAYRDVAYVVLDRFAIGDYGNRIPQLQFEVVRPVGAFHKSVRAVALLPGAIEYGLSPLPVTRQLRPGERQSINRNVLWAGTDIAASLDELQAICPELQNIALVVAWFGDDLRAGHCRIRPAVTTANGSGLSAAWRVSGLERSAAPVISTSNGGPAYGGTPSDKSVMDAIAEIKSRGLGVTLYPFIMMDIPDGNTLPDPEGGASQPAYPWRGRITCDPAPFREDSVDRSAVARAQVEAFCGEASPEQLSLAGETVLFSGDPDEWGYRRLVLHYARLAVAAGGVNAFLIGSELRGLTTVRDGSDAFPFVDALCDLAADVRSILGAGPLISYGADWSEYFGYQPADGSGDVYFHLDALWAHDAIDAVGIDNYMPLSDWRDADYAGGNPDGFAGPYDPDGLRAGITSGEGFDWYYPDSTARLARERSLIVDGSYGKPWVYRCKDIVSWWSSPHYDRIAGIERDTPTAWVPQTKPIWFSELGCPAVDKGPNQPNVFPDPKSVEGGLPYFSSGGRSDLAQRRFLEAHFTHWDPDNLGFNEGANPVSAVYGGRMVDVSRLYLWAWDARPYPAFPLRGDLWSDGTNWSYGHWLNGRLANPDLGSLINAVLADHGQSSADVSGLDGTVEGFVLADPTSAREALEPLIDLFDIAVCEAPDGLVFRQAGGNAISAVQLEDLAYSEDGPLIETVRDPDDDLPAEALLSFRDAFAEYQTVSVSRNWPDATGSRQRTLSFVGSLAAGQGRALLDDWLKRSWSRRQTATFFLAGQQDDVVPGAIVSLPNGASELLVTGIDEGILRKVTAREVIRDAPTRWIASAPAALPATSPAAGPPHALFLDLPAAVGSGDAIDQFRVAAWRKPWRSQALFASPEDAGFTARGTIAAPASLGRLVQPLPPGFVGRMDRSSTITVELFDAALSSVSDLQLFNGGNAAAVRSSAGPWEIIQFRGAEEVASGIWLLSDLLRGQLGTSDAVAVGASAGADFVMLDDALVPAGLHPGEAGLELNWRVGPSGSDISNASFVTSVQNGGTRALLPYAPVHLRGDWNGTDLVFSWVRCGRIDADRWEASEIPLAEETESYEVAIAAAGGSTLRTATVSTASWLYTAAAIAGDFPILPTEIDVTVRQFSSSVGWGLPVSRRIALT